MIKAIKPFATSLDLTLVFDGSIDKYQETKRYHIQDLEIVYTSEEESADDYIIKELENIKFPGAHTVVTSDKQLSARAKALGARLQNISEFFEFLLKKRTKNSKGKAPDGKIFKDSDPEIKRLLGIFEAKLTNPHE